jgi:hypothetical protein
MLVASIMLIIGQPDKKTHRPEKQYRKHSVNCCVNGQSTQWCELRMFLKPVFPYCTSEHLAKVHDTAKSLLHWSPSPHFLQPTITCRLVIPLLNVAFRQSVPSQILFSITCGFVASISSARRSNALWEI